MPGQTNLDHELPIDKEDIQEKPVVPLITPAEAEQFTMSKEEMAEKLEEQLKKQKI